MALTAETLFVNPDYLRRITSLNGSVDESFIVPAVIVAQDKVLQAYLGTDLMTKLKAEAASGSPDAVYINLLDNYVRKVVAWWTMCELMPTLYVKINNGSLAIRTAENTTSITADDLHREVERARDNAEFYTERLVKHLMNNSQLYPEYTTNSGGDMLPQTETYNQNGMTISGRSDTELKRYLFS